MRRGSTLALRILGRLGPRRQAPIGEAPLGRILVVRFGGLGDVVTATGLLATLRRRYPQAEITVLTTAAAAPLLDGHADLDRVVTTPDLRWSGNLPRSLAHAWRYRRLTRPPADAVFVLHPDLQRLALGAFARARYKVGFDVNGRGFDFAMTHGAPLYVGAHPRAGESVGRHVNSLNHDLLRALTGLQIAESPPRLAVGGEERRRAADWLAGRGLAAPLVVLLPGGSAEIKRWPDARFAELARRLAAEDGCSVLCLGGPAEAGLRAVYAEAGPAVACAFGELDLRSTLAVLAAADLVVGNDCGPLHAATALGTATVAVFGPTAWWAYGAEGERHAVLRTDLPCMPCDAEVCALLPPERRGEVPPCLDAVGPERVHAAARAALAGAPAVAAAPDGPRGFA